MIEVDVPATSSAGAALSDRYPSIAISRQSHSSMEADNEAPESNFQSAYYAPPYPRPQADRDHQQESLLQDRARGDLTAHNLELIPDADHVAPGIRLDRGGNDYPFQRGARNETRQENTRENEHVVGGGEVALDSGHPNDKRSSLGGKTLSSIGAATGRSSNGGLDAEVEGIEGDAHVDESGDLFEDVNEDLDDDVVFDEKNVAIVHERVGGSGATSENASKGTSVGHFGPRGEAIPGVPPHLDPRQPHFRPPSPGAASVLSVAVHPPASPKLHGASGLGNTPGMTTSMSSEISDSGEETESFDNGAMTPTLSEMEDDDHIDKTRGIGPSSPNAGGSSIDSAHHYNFARMSLGSGGGPQVSFDPNVQSHESDDFVGLMRTARAPSIAATAGSSRAPSARGLSPPVSLSRVTTTEGSSFEEYGSTGTGLEESGAETPSIIRSRRSSYSAPSSEVEGATGGSAGMEAADSSTRARGATLVANAANRMGNSTTNLHDEPEDDLRDGPSLAPSEAGSDSTRSMTHDSSSVGHGLYVSNSSTTQPLGGLGSNDLLARHLQSSSNDSPVPSSSPYEAAPTQGDAHPKAPIQPILPSLLAIKKASRRNGSGAASTAATAGTTSPASSLSMEGDFEDASGAFTEQQQS